MSHSNCITASSDRQRGKHLNFEGRCTIKVCRKMNLSLRKTAEIVNCSPSTVMNELKRGTGERPQNERYNRIFRRYAPKNIQQNRFLGLQMT